MNVKNVGQLKELNTGCALASYLLMVTDLMPSIATTTPRFLGLQIENPWLFYPYFLD